MTDRNKFILGLAVLALTLILGAWQFSESHALKVDTNSFNKQITLLNASKQKLDAQYQEIKVATNKTRSSSEQEITYVLPVAEDITELTRLLDEFAAKNNFSSNPLFISNVIYGKNAAVEGTTYSYVPLTLSMTSSKKNLLKFLGFVEGSGNLESQVRLMSIENLSLRYPKEYGGTYEAQITLNAYFYPALNGDKSNK